MSPTAVSAPRLLAWSDDCASVLGLSRPASATLGEATGEIGGATVEILAGNRLAATMRPYAARYGGGDRNVVNRWNLTEINGIAVTPVAADNGNPFYSGFTEHGIVSFPAGPGGSLYFTDSGQGPSTGTTWRLGRIRFVGGTQPVANFTVSPSSGQSPLQVTFTDTSTAPSSSIASRKS